MQRERLLIWSLATLAAPILLGCQSPTPAANVTPLAGQPADATGHVAIAGVNQLDCKPCAQALVNRLTRIVGVTDVGVYPAAGEVYVYLRPDAPIVAQDIEQAIVDSGFTLNWLDFYVNTVRAAAD